MILSSSKGWSSDTIQTTIVDSKDDLYAEDDLGFDPFHETQKALAEMLESESKLQNIYSSSQSPPNFSNATSQQQIVTNVIHQSNNSSQHQNSNTNGTGNGMPHLPPGLPSTNTSVMNNGRLPLKQPPPGFGHQSLLSQDTNGFGLGTQANGSNAEGNNFNSGLNHHTFGQQNDFLGGNGFPNSSRGLRNISGNGANGSLNFPQHSSNHGQSMQQQMNHTNHQDVSDHLLRLGQQSSSGNIDHLQQQLRQLSFEKQNIQQAKDWQEGLRALLPNVNVSFEGLPNGEGFSGGNNLNSNQNSHSHIDLESRFNHSQSGNSNNHLLNDHRPHNLINSLQQNGPNVSHPRQGNHNNPNHLNHQQQHMNLQQHERHQLQQQRSHNGNIHEFLLRNNRIKVRLNTTILGICINGYISYSLLGWGNMSANDWTVLDPAIVSGQLSDHNQSQQNGPMRHGVNGPLHGSRSDSPPHWIKANLEQLTAETNISSNSNRDYPNAVQPFNIGQLLSGPPNAGLGGLPSPNNTSNSNSAVQAALAGWSGQPNILGHNTPPPGFMSRGSAAPGLGQNGPLPQHHPFQNMSNSNGTNDQIENEFQRLIHSK